MLYEQQTITLEFASGYLHIYKWKASWNLIIVHKSQAYCTSVYIEYSHVSLECLGYN